MNWKKLALLIALNAAFFYGYFGAAFDLFFRVYNPPLTVFRYLHYYIYTYLPYQLPLVAYYLFRHRLTRIQSLFSPKFWTPPLAVSVGACALAGDNISSILGFAWLWYAPAIWLALFAAQLWIFSRQMPNTHAFFLSYLGVFVASFIYELPMFQVFEFRHVAALLGIGLYVFLVYRLGFRPGRALAAVVIPLLAEVGFGYMDYTAYHNWSGDWLYRFAVFPLILYIALGTKKHGDIR